MDNQNYKNHTRLIPSYHIGVLGALVLGLIGSLVNLINANPQTVYSASLLTLLFAIAIITFFFNRGFALRAQDRAIRAEEKFRYYRMTGKDFPHELSMRQIIGLRFASDEEYVALMERAVNENLSEKTIKKEIKSWKADHHRA